AGVSLFQRSQRGTRLSEAGERLLLRAELARVELRSGHDELAALCGLAPGRIAVGALPMAGDVLVPQALARLFAVMPGVQATVVDGTYEALVDQLRHGEVDLVVGPLRGEQAPADLREQLLFIDHLVPVVRAGHPLARSRGGARTLAALLALPWIGPLPGTPARAAFERAFDTEGLAVPPVSLQVNSPAVVRALLLASDAVALLSPLQVRGEVGAGQLRVLPVAVQRTERAIGLMLRRDGLPSPALRALLMELQVVAAVSMRS
ncbi:MAG: LysR substrate-binding domain-containing protein, partial [Rubrivivax sp.]|nr:LysR substrate-binding domain-containing protein [Rubrivivax sp.]